MTIRESLMCGAEGEVSREQLDEATQRAIAYTFIHAMEKGYDTRVGDKGSQLSGGQKQRIAVARALIRKPSFDTGDCIFSSSGNQCVKSSDSLTGYCGTATSISADSTPTGSTYFDAGDCIYNSSGSQCIKASGSLAGYCVTATSTSSGATLAGTGNICFDAGDCLFSITGETSINLHYRPLRSSVNYQILRIAVDRQ